VHSTPFRPRSSVVNPCVLCHIAHLDSDTDFWTVDCARSETNAGTEDRYTHTQVWRHVTLCISSDNHTTKHRYGLQCRTKWSEKLSVLDAQARRGLDKSVPNYPGRTTGLVGIVLLGSTQVVSTSEWTKSVPLLKKLLCTVNLSTVFVTEILWVWSSQDTHSSIPNAMFRLVDFPGHRLSHDVLDTVLVRQPQYNAHHKETVRIKKLKLK
jgi:hypothetical protein